MLAFGATQVGVLLSAEGPMRRALSNVKLWTAVVAANGLIMSIYLWHMTSMVLVIGGALLLDGAGLHLVPGGVAWWLTRPIWLAVLAVATVPLVALFARFDSVKPLEGSVSWPVAGAAVVTGGLGLALLARGGIVGDFLGIRPDAVVLIGVAAVLLSARVRRFATRPVA